MEVSRQESKTGGLFMSMVAARMQKMKAENLIGLGNHNQRKTANHSNQEIDVTRSHLNYDLVDRTNNYKTDIQTFINETKASSRAVRKDAVLVSEWIITSDTDFFKTLDEKQTRTFFEVAKNYFAENYGEENIRYAQVHVDERTPHMHLGIVPFTDDKRLSSKTIFNRQALKTIQEELPIELKKQGFAIERGEQGSTRSHMAVQEFKDYKETITKHSQLTKVVDGLERDYQKYQGVMDTVKDINVPTEPLLEKRGFLKREEIETDKVIISKKDFETLHEAYRYVPVLKKEVRAAKRAEQAQAEEKMQIKAQRDELKKENKQLQKMVAGAKKMLLKLDDYLEKHLGISFKDALAEDPDKHREKQAPESEKKGPQGPSL